MKNETQIVIDADGSVTTPNVHDGSLVGLFILSNRRIVLAIRDVQDVVHYLQLNRVEGFQGDNLKEGNIILDLTVTSGGSVEADVVAHVLGIESKSPYEPHLAKTLTRVRTKELVIVQLSPSYGCALACLCSNVAVLSEAEIKDVFASISS